ncbi:MAG: phosphatase PAP2 family protein [Firmicutes bacterium]|nr:phosphatase PAP2 family protein [Bacillota bacterium]
MLAEIGNTWSLPFENPFIIWFQNLGGKGSFLHYFLYYIMNFFSMFGEEMILVGIVGLLYWGLDKKGGEKVGFMMISATIVNPLIKNIVCRTRPFDSEAGIANLRDVDGYSFPSGHSSGSAATLSATTLTYKDKKQKWLIALCVTVPLLVALSRTFVGAHYPTDVVCGLALGVGIVFLINFLYSVIPNKYFLYGGMAILGLAGFFYCTTSDFYTAYGLLIGFICGVIFEEKVSKFDNTKVWWRIVLRVIVGGALFLGLNEIIKLPVKLAYPDYADAVWFERIFRVLRYGIVTFLLIGVYPMLFKQTEKLWKKFGWLKEQAEQEIPNDGETLPVATLKKNVLAIAGFALSFVIGFAGIVLSAIGCKRARKDGYDCKRLSVAGIAVSCVWILIFAVCMLAMISCLKGEYLFMKG